MTRYQLNDPLQATAARRTALAMRRAVTGVEALTRVEVGAPGGVVAAVLGNDDDVASRGAEERPRK